MQHHSRFLGTNKAVEDFFEATLRLNYKTDPKLNGIIAKVVDGEIGVSNFNAEMQTLSVKDMRHSDYRDEEKRWELRKQIIDELYTMTRLPIDEDIALKNGGALPASGIKSEKQAFLIIGLPASGKSGIAEAIAEDYGGIIIDSDYAKRKLPEYKSHYYSSSIVHNESSNITFGFSIPNPHNIKSLYEVAVEEKNNIIIPRIGQNPQSIINSAIALKENKGYDVHLILVSLSKRDATIRAVYRYAETGRYVPLGMIFDGYGNDPALCYYYLRCKHSNIFDSFGVISTASRPPVCTDVYEKSPVLKYQYKDLILQLS
jgi:hypothetical protein